MKDLTKKMCFRPWDFMEIQDDTTMYPCCPNWVNQYNFGKVKINEGFEHRWNGEKAQRFRESILDGSYRYCNRVQCPMIQNDTLPNVEDVLAGKHGDDKKKIYEEKQLISSNPNFINLCYDRSCNLRCPSCRENFIFLNEKAVGNEYYTKVQFQEKLIEYLYTCKVKTTINVTGSGDPFASKLFWGFLTSFEGVKNPLVEFQLQTNGVLFTEENWNKLEKIHNNPISTIISLDAGTEETYNYTRKGGDWKKLLRNLNFVEKLYDAKKLHWVRLDFVCQQKNYKEIPLFINIARSHGFYCYLSRIVNWGTYSPDEFSKHNIFDPNHPEHSDFLNVIRQDMNYDLIDFGNLTEFRTT